MIAKGRFPKTIHNLLEKQLELSKRPVEEQIDELLIDSRKQLIRRPYKYEATKEVIQTLRKKYNWIDGVAQFLCVFGIIVGMLPCILGNSCTGWDIAVQFGLGVFLPCLWCFFMTIRRSQRELQEFLLFYSLKYGMHWKGIFYFLYLPFILLGAIGAIMVYGVR